MKKRTDGRYCKQILIGYKPDGTRRMRTIYGKTIKEVEKKERELREQIDRGINVSKIMTVEEWADEWIRTYKNDLSYYTVRRYKSIINIHIKPNLGKMKLEDVKLWHIQNLINEMEDYSASSIKKLRDTLHQMYTTAIANDLVIKDPTVGLIINKREKNERKALSEEEIEKINEFCKISDCGTFRYDSSLYRIEER